MSFTDSFTAQYTQSPGATPYSGTLSNTGANQENLDLPATAGPGVLTNAQVIVTKAKLLSLLLVCDQTITLFTQSSSAPQDTLNITANVPYYWSVNVGSVFACPFSNNVSLVFVNNLTNVIANFKMRTVQNN